MARVPEQLRTEPAYRELRYLMREGLMIGHALRCDALLQSPRVQGVVPKTVRDREQAEAGVLVDLLLHDTESPKVASIVSVESLRLLFPAGEPEDSFTSRRTAVMNREHVSDSTVSRREHAICIALLANFGLIPASGPSPASRESPDPRIKGLDGVWFALWETTVHGEQNFNMEQLVCAVEGHKLAIHNEAPSPHNPEGYLWQGYLEAIQPHLLVGSYAAIDPKTEWAGTLCYQLGGGGRFMEGSWTGQNIDAPMNSGHSVIARDEGVARRRFAVLVGGSKAIPRMSSGRIEDRPGKN